MLDSGLSGPVNAVAPEPVRNIDYTRTLAAVLRLAVPPIPGLGPRLLLGEEGAREIAQANQYVRPERLIQAGHRFRQPDLEGALRHLFGRGVRRHVTRRRIAFDEVFNRMWKFYLCYSEAGFRAGYIGVSQLTLARMGVHQIIAVRPER